MFWILKNIISFIAQYERGQNSPIPTQIHTHTPNLVLHIYLFFLSHNVNKNENTAFRIIVVISVDNLKFQIDVVTINLSENFL